MDIQLKAGLTSGKKDYAALTKLPKDEVELNLLFILYWRARDYCCPVIMEMTEMSFGQTDFFPRKKGILCICNRRK